MQIQKTVFISYRRTNIFTARAVYQHLMTHGYDVFLDYENVDSGAFDQIILNQIAARAHFILILTPSALERCPEPGDWLRREIEHAIELKRNIVPLMFENFDFGQVDKYLVSPNLQLLKQYNGLLVPPEYFEEAMTRLHTRFLNKPLEMILHPTPPNDHEEVAQRHAVAVAAPPVTEKQLSSEEYFERGIIHQEANDSDKAIFYYTEAIRLNPQFANAYNNRGLAYIGIDDRDKALTDYNEAIRLSPRFAEAYNNRGLAYITIGDRDKALADYNEAIRLNPNFAEAYNNRGLAYAGVGDVDKEIADYNEAIRLNPQYAIAYYNRGLAYAGMGDVDKEIADYSEAIRLNPQYAEAYNNRGEVFFALQSFSEALADFKRANELSPADNTILAGLAVTHHALGELQQAKAIWGLLLKLDGRYRDADWVGQEHNWHSSLTDEARKLIGAL